MTPSKRRVSLENRRRLKGYLFILPWVIGFVPFFGMNFYQTILFSFNNLKINPLGGYSLSFVGIENFRNALLSHASFNRTLAESLGNMLIDVPLIIFFSLFLAILISKRFRGRAFVRAVLFLPVIMLTGAVMTAMDSSLSKLMGGISSVTNLTAGGDSETAGLNAAYLMGFLKEFGVPGNLIDYIVEAITRIYEIVRASGVQILIFLAALQSVPEALYEVAKIEGATAYETFWKITFPMISPLIVTNMVYTIIDLYSRTDIIKMASETAFTNFDFGLSAAMSLMSSISVCLILAISVGLVNRKVFYQS